MNAGMKSGHDFERERECDCAAVHLYAVLPRAPGTSRGSNDASWITALGEGARRGLRRVYFVPQLALVEEQGGETIHQLLQRRLEDEQSARLEGSLSFSFRRRRRARGVRPGPAQSSRTVALYRVPSCPLCIESCVFRWFRGSRVFNWTGGGGRSGDGVPNNWGDGVWERDSIDRVIDSHELKASEMFLWGCPWSFRFCTEYKVKKMFREPRDPRIRKCPFQIFCSNLGPDDLRDPGDRFRLVLGGFVS